MCQKMSVFVANISSLENHVNWVPTLNLGKKKCVEEDFKQVAEKAEWTK